MNSSLGRVRADPADGSSGGFYGDKAALFNRRVSASLRVAVETVFMKTASAEGLRSWERKVGSRGGI